MPDQIIIPPLIWVRDNFGEHYKWKDCVDKGMECDIKKCPSACMCDALTLEYDGDRSQPLIKQIHHTIGKILWGRDIGRIKRPYSKFIWSQCPDCKKERWVEVKSMTKQTGHTLCSICKGRRNGKLNSKRGGQ